VVSNMLYEPCARPSSWRLRLENYTAIATAKLPNRRGLAGGFVFLEPASSVWGTTGVTVAKAKQA